MNKSVPTDVTDLTDDQKAEHELREAQAIRHREKLEFMEKIADQISEKEGLLPEVGTAPEPGDKGTKESEESSAPTTPTTPAPTVSTTEDDGKYAPTTDRIMGSPPESLITLIVDGAKVEVPESKVREAGIRALQKESAADKRLEEATRLLREAKEAAKATEKPPSPKAPDPLAAKVAKTLMTGEEDEAVAAIDELLGSVPSLTPEQVLHMVEAKLEQERIRGKFQDTFKDLMEDPYLFDMTVRETDRLLRSGEPNNWDTYNKAGINIREWRDRVVSKHKGPESDPLVDKLERKREASASSPPVPAASGKHAPPPAESKVETVQDVINLMRKHRGERL